MYGKKKELQPKHLSTSMRFRGYARLPELEIILIRKQNLPTQKIFLAGDIPLTDMINCHDIPSGKLTGRNGKPPFLIEIHLQRVDFPLQLVSLPEGSLPSLWWITRLSAKLLTISRVPAPAYQVSFRFFQPPNLWGGGIRQRHFLLRGCFKWNGMFFQLAYNIPSPAPSTNLSIDDFPETFPR